VAEEDVSIVEDDDSDNDADKIGGEEI